MHHLELERRFVRIRVRREPSAAVDSATQAPTDVPTDHSTTTKLSAPALIGIVLVVMIAVGLGYIVWRWRTRMKASASLMDQVSFGKSGRFGVGRGIESSGSGEQVEEKLERYDSFLDCDTDKPKKAIINFGRSSNTNSNNKRSSWHPQPKASYTPPRAEPPVVKRPAERKLVKVQHLPTVQTKAISAPLIVANGGPEPLSPPVHVPVVIQPQPPPPAVKKKPKQPHPRSPPPSPALNHSKENFLAPPKKQEPAYSLSSSSKRNPDPTSSFAASSDGSLYSRNSFSSSRGQLGPQQPAHSYSPPSYDNESRPGSAGSQQSQLHHRLMTVVAPFVPTMEDELLLKMGDTVRVIEEYKDAWCLVQQVGRMDSPRGVVPCVCLQERKRIVPLPTHKTSNASLASQNRR